MRIIVFVLILLPLKGICQNERIYKIRTIAFYNVENLFDTVNDTLIFDDDRTPNGTFNWTNGRYQKKIENLAQVISKVGADMTSTSPDIVGLCEVENIKVLEDLVSNSVLQKNDYGIVHFDSPDDRGIDVALLYKRTAYNPISFKSHRLLLFDEDGNRDYTRDQLVVGGYLDNEQVHFIVNHWPSRRGGELRSRPLRVKAAQLTKRILDSLNYQNPNSKVIVMGDFNDDPINISLKKILNSKGKQKQLDSISLFNPMEKLFRKGVGSLAYRDKWNLFDQFLLTPNFVEKNKPHYTYWKAGIFNPDYLQNKNGRYKGYPFRTYVGTTYQGGYADHFPVYLHLIKKASSDPSKGEE